MRELGQFTDQLKTKMQFDAWYYVVDDVTCDVIENLPIELVAKCAVPSWQEPDGSFFPLPGGWSWDGSQYYLVKDSRYTVWRDRLTGVWVVLVPTDHKTDDYLPESQNFKTIKMETAPGAFRAAEYKLQEAQESTNGRA